jgi:hypothetical protein
MRRSSNVRNERRMVEIARREQGTAASRAATGADERAAAVVGGSDPDTGDPLAVSLLDLTPIGEGFILS